MLWFHPGSDGGRRMPASLARLIVCEKTGLWASAWRRVLAAEEPRVHETRSLEDLWQALQDHPASLAALEITATNAAQVAAWLTRFKRAYPAARAVICTNSTLDAIAAIWREAGAVGVYCSPRELAPATRLAKRHLEDAPQRERTLRQQIWDRLPWQSPR